jgi:Zn-dependent protease/CBS domain-containing protein
MKWSLRLGTIGGVALYVHFTFLLLLAFIVLSHLLVDGNVENALAQLVFILLVFGIVVLHELGHAFAARHYGIATRDITLLPIGGVARLERMPEDPRQEIVVALAGPAVNFFLAGLLYLWLTPEELRSAWSLQLNEGMLLPRLFTVNVMLAVFNLIPAFPMDGGRVLRALLAFRGDYVQATQTAAAVGQFVALLFGFIGLLAPNPLLLFVALFVYMGAAAESGMVQVRAALAGIPVARAMVREFHALHPEDSLDVAVQHVLAGFQHDFPVVADGKVVGVLTRGDLLAALAKAGDRGQVGEAMQKTFQTADPAEMLEHVMNRLQECECRSMPVVRDGKLVGLITLDNVGEWLMIRSALREAKRVES